MRGFPSAARRHNLVILELPAFVRRKQALPGALAEYKDINLLGLRLLKPEGFLVTCSCSHPVSEADFRNSICLAVRDAMRNLPLIERRGQSADHHILASMSETLYLKCFIVQVL